MFSSFPFFRYGHQTADIKPFPKLTSARLFSQEPRKKLLLRRHEASLKIFEDKACKVPTKTLSSQLLSRSSKHGLLVPVLSHMAIKPDRFSLLAGWQYGRAEFQRRGLGRRGHFSWPKLGKKYRVKRVIPSSSVLLFSLHHHHRHHHICIVFSPPPPPPPPPHFYCFLSTTKSKTIKNNRNVAVVVVVEGKQ